MMIHGRTGPVAIGDGVEEKMRITREGAQVVQALHAKYTESNFRGQLFSVSTSAAGVAPGTALSTTPPLALWNPPNSGVMAVIIESYLGFISGTLGAGSIVYGLVAPQSSAPTGGTPLTNQSAKIGLPQKGACSAFQGSTLTAAPTILKPAFAIGGNPSGVLPAKDAVEGAIIVPPGAVLALQGITAAGATPLVLLGLSWEEIPA